MADRFLNDARSTLNSVVAQHMNSVLANGGKGGSDTRPWESSLRDYVESSNIILEADARVVLTDLVQHSSLVPDKGLSYEEYHMAFVALRNIALDALYVNAEHGKEIEVMAQSLFDARRELELRQMLSEQEREEKKTEQSHTDQVLRNENRALRTQVRCLTAEVERLRSTFVGEGTKETSGATLECHLLALSNSIRSFHEWVMSDFMSSVLQTIHKVVPGWRYKQSEIRAENESPQEVVERTQQTLEVCCEQLKALPEVFLRDRDRRLGEMRLLEVLLFDTSTLQSVSDNTLTQMRRCVIDELEVQQEGRWLDELLRTLPRATEFVCAQKSLGVEKMHERMTKWVKEMRTRIIRRSDELKDMRMKLGWLGSVVNGTVASIRADLRAETTTWKEASLPVEHSVNPRDPTEGNTSPSKGGQSESDQRAISLQTTTNQSGPAPNDKSFTSSRDLEAERRMVPKLSPLKIQEVACRRIHSATATTAKVLRRQPLPQGSFSPRNQQRHAYKTQKPFYASRMKNAMEGVQRVQLSLHTQPLQGVPPRQRVANSANKERSKLSPHGSALT